MDKAIYRRDEIQERLLLWAKSQTKPKHIFPVGLEERIGPDEITAMNRVRNLHAKKLNKKLFAENWIAFLYMDGVGIRYLLPTFLHLDMESGMFPMADMTPLFAVVSGISDAGMVSTRTRRIYGLLSCDQKRVVAYYYLWVVR